MKICPSCRGGAVIHQEVCAQCGADLGRARARSGCELAGMVLADKYELLELIGEGAMGWVYRARHLSLASSVAVKLMKPDLHDSADRSTRFEREARAASRLNHPHILSVSDFGQTPGGFLYIVSELLRGSPLDLVLDGSGPMPMGRVMRIFCQVLEALEEAHRHSIVHRDIKPENIIVTSLRSGEDLVKVVDFGIVKVEESGSSGSRLTRRGQILGTPAYMAPEQARGEPVCVGTDLYSCGALLFTMLAGRPPFWSDSVVEIMAAHMNQPPPSLADVAPHRRWWPELEAVLARALQKSPADRYHSAAELQADFAAAVRAAAAHTLDCPFCGQPLRLDVKFCSSCGGRQREDTLPGRESGLMISASAPPLRAGAPGTPPGALDLRTVTARSAPIFMSTLDRRLFAERSLELQVLGQEQERARWRAFLAGDGAVMEILGPLGSGKTSLLGEVARDAAEQGLRVISAGPDPSLSRAPWYPIRQIVAELLGLEALPPDRLALQAAADRAGVAELDVPGLALLFGHSAPDESLELAVRERETRAAARRVLLASREGLSGLCVLLDDVDRFDGASADFLQELAASVGGSSVKLVMASRESLLEEKLPRTTLAPAPLTPADVQTLLDIAFEGRSDALDVTAASLVERTAGLPLHLVQAIRLLVESGEELGCALPDLLAIRIGRLPTPALRVLQILSALGESASLGAVQRLWNAEGGWEEAVTLLIRRGFVLPEPADRLHLSHPSLVDAVQESMAADARRALHRRIFERMVRTPTDPVVMARHAFEAKLGERSLELLEEAAAEARDSLDDVGAVIHLRRAVRVARWELLLDPDSPRCLALAFQLSEALSYSGDHLSAEVVLKEVVALADRAPDVGALIWRSLARLERGRGSLHEAEAAMRRAVGLAVRSGDSALLTQMYTELGRVLAAREDWGATAAELEEGALLVTGGEGWQAEQAPRGFWRLLADAARLYSRQGLHLHAMELARGALAHAQREPTLLGQARSHYLLGSLFDEAKLRSPAASHYRQAHRRFRDLGDRRSQGECLLALAAHEPPGVENAPAREALELFEQVCYHPGVKLVRSSGHLVP